MHRQKQNNTSLSKAGTHIVKRKVLHMITQIQWLGLSEFCTEKKWKFCARFSWILRTFSSRFLPRCM